MKKVTRVYYFLLIGFMAASHSMAVTPMEYFNSLVAGGYERGYRDGTFIKAYFNDPSGIAFDQTGEKIFVADSSNNRIRVVDLANHNQVETLVGTGAAGSVDGLFEKATFAVPQQVTSLPENRLAVYDAGDNVIRLIDIKTRTVSTIAHGVIVWNMVYRSQDNCLYFSQTAYKNLSKLDLKSLVVSPVFSNNPLIPSPMALCLAGDKFYVSDRDSSKVYEMSLADDKSSDHKDITFKEIGKGDNIIELAFSGGNLYALQTGKVPLVRVGSPLSTPVNIATTWGFFAESDHEGVEPFMALQPAQAYGFAASPNEPHKLYITRPYIGPNAIVSVKDYGFGANWTIADSKKSESGLTDFDYPAQKPERTYRILIVGDARTTSGIRTAADIGNKADKGTGTFRTDTFPKQLEFFLNADGNLQNVGTHFEVLTLGRDEKALSSYAADEVPGLVKKYDVDLVLGLADEADVKKGSLDSTASNLKNLSKKIQELKLDDGVLPKLSFFYVPSSVFHNDVAAPAWKELCAKNGFSFIDLTEPFNGLKTSYYPTSQKGLEPAYTAYGSELVANILSRYLENNQMIPFAASKQ